MRKERRFSRILLYQGVGFFAIMLFCWADLLFDLHDLVLQSNTGMARPIGSCLLQTLSIMLVWFLVSTSSRRVWEKLRNLEDFLRMCSWCRRIDYRGRWMPIEEFLNQSYDTPTTHGICDECLSQQMASLKSSQERSIAKTEAS